MSRTRKDRKHRWHDIDDIPDWKFRWRANSRIWRFVQDWWGKERARVRSQLKKGEEPEPSRTRSSVKWDID